MEQVILLLLFIASGYAMAKSGIAKSGDYKPFMDFSLNVLIPASVVLSFLRLEITESLYLSLGILALSFVLGIAASYALARALRLGQNEGYALLLCGFYGNIGFLGYPIIETLLGKDSLAIAAIYVLAYNFAAYAVVFPYIRLRISKKAGANGNPSAIFSAPSLAAFLGIAIYASGLDLSLAIPFIQPFAGLMTPFSMIAIGLFVSDKLNVRFDRGLLSMVLAKCFVFPAITLGLLAFSGLLPASKEMLLLSFMPLAISNFVLIGSLEAGLDRLVADSIIVSTIVSLALIFGLAWSGFF